MDSIAPRAAVYCRISRDQAGAGAGVERQREACLTLAQQRGWSVDPGHVITENDMSASTGKRPGYARLLALAERRDIDVIIGWAVDRLTRKVTELETLIELSERTGVKVATVSGDLDLTTDSGRLVGRILASVARGEVERKGTRQKAANLQRAERGEPPQRRAYGYRDDGSPHPTEADHVRQLFARFAAGASLKSATDWFNASGQRQTREGLGPWTRAGIRGLLRNRRYIGERWLNREYVGPGNWEPLVTPDLFEAVQTILNDPARLNHSGSARKWLGAGLYLCGACGDGTKVRTWQKSRRIKDGTIVHRRMYVCANRDVMHLQRTAQPVDDYVTAVILERLRRPDVAGLIDHGRDAGKVRQLRDEAVGIRGRLDGIAADYAAGDLTARQVKIATDRMTTRLAEVEAALSEHGSRSALGQVAAAADPGAAWLALDVVQRAAVVETLCTVTILKGRPGARTFDPDTVRIEPRR